MAKAIFISATKPPALPYLLSSPGLPSMKDCRWARALEALPGAWSGQEGRCTGEGNGRRSALGGTACLGEKVRLSGLATEHEIAVAEDPLRRDVALLAQK
jgi:hypothetical protein